MDAFEATAGADNCVFNLGRCVQSACEAYRDAMTEQHVAEVEQARREAGRFADYMRIAAEEDDTPQTAAEWLAEFEEAQEFVEDMTQAAIRARGATP
ncbi:hypothetical protein EOD42_25555 [Rhodovarius crocodyli]|uniref:Uncharacterized protein n=2 Tax=Rhodovarius crocodyli TaxID=1979269 RepID=A0A437LV47_9PROT|nr:hypothetical protein EOD42_25555 [Rhodovarius crocodyli]